GTRRRTSMITPSTGRTRGQIERARDVHHAARAVAITYLLFAALAAAGLTGCGGVSKSQLTDAINEHLKEKTCFAVQKTKEPSWPMRVRRPGGLMSEEPLDPILAAIKAAGYLKVAQEKQGEGVFADTVDVVTPTEKAKAWWVVPEGFCVGTKAVAEV